MIRHEIDISMTATTVETLHGSGFVLYGFRPVRSRNRDARGLVLFAREDFSASTHVRLEPAPLACTSFDSILPGREVRAGFSVEMTPGQTLVVGPGGIGKIERGGPDDALGFHNTGSRTVTCGIAAMSQGEATPYCAVPVFPGFADSIVPTDKVLLIFSTTVLAPGTVVESLFELSARGGSLSRRTATSPGVLVDLAATERSIRFGLETGWQWGEETWAQPVSARTNLLPLLIEMP